MITVKKDKALNQWLEEQLKAELIVESSSRYSIMLIDWISNWQTQKHKILQQTGSYLGIQQCMNQRRQQMENSVSNEQKTIWTKSDICQDRWWWTSFLVSLFTLFYFYFYFSFIFFYF